MMNIKLLFFLLISGFACAQMPNISKVWLNDGKPYVGNIGKDNTAIKFTIDASEQNPKNDQEYLVSGHSSVEGNDAKWDGKMTITKYKDSKKGGKVFGEYIFLEEKKGKHSGVFKGKFILTFKWNKKTEKVEETLIEFLGNWKSYDGTLDFKTKWKNQ